MAVEQMFDTLYIPSALPHLYKVICDRRMCSYFHTVILCYKARRYYTACPTTKHSKSSDDLRAIGDYYMTGYT